MGEAPHAEKLPLSSLHSTSDGLPPVVKPKVAAVSLVRALGPLRMSTVGPMVSIVQLRLSWLVWFTPSVALTVKVCGPSGSPE